MNILVTGANGHFLFDELPAIDLSAQEAYLTEAYLTKTAK